MKMRKVLIIAEAGVNHNGSIETAKRLVDVAAEAGADYVKFQTFKADKLVTKNAKKASYQVKNMSGDDNSQYEMLKKLELTEENHYELKSYCNSKNIKFLSTGFDNESVNFLDNLGIDIFKVPSGEITNYSYLKNIATKGKPIILSTGMCTLDEIGDAFNLLITEGVSKDNMTILHCNTEYPTPFEDVNLRAMPIIGSTFDVQYGYSDHTLGIEVPVAAVALGAVCIEKHFTLDRSMEGPDHVASLNPAELKAMIDSIRNIELSMSGNGIKEPSKSELENILIARKSIHIADDLPKGTVIEEKHLVAKRPGGGLSPMQTPDIVGKLLTRNMLADEMLNLEDFEK
jgi:N-acetylneuraminate synthase/N,N'-diacetyllegionaminate synthase